MDVGVLGQGDFDQRFVLFLAQDDADGGIFGFGPDVAVEVVDVHLYLAKVLMSELADLEVDQYIAAQKAVVEDEVDKEMVAVEGKSLLSSLEQEALTEFTSGSLSRSLGGRQSGLVSPVGEYLPCHGSGPGVRRDCC
jgi:hypothetical protein